ncbi:hypothetical protein [Rhodococcus maanshanensis]|uniref:Uncharacterized protein n=1 Tax=Rhodococcus maanshanensis TaxID=183556 RepID=A0A1H7LVZ2_9NOCA|nr:hypothetical protein [Rhodococcus maanshanensis]SEL02888.1 hypothetical protein SAMN05444583_105164 [Rhodococcus maanshanensis]
MNEDPSMWLDWAKILAPIIAALVAGGFALRVSNRNVRTISENADRTIAAAEANADKSIAAAAENVARSVKASAEGTDKTITAAEDRERRNWVRAQTVEAAAAILAAATELDIRVDRAVKALTWRAESWGSPKRGVLTSRHRHEKSPSEFFMEVEDALADLNRAIDLFQFVADEQPCSAAEMFRLTYNHIMVQIRFLTQFADGNVEGVRLPDNASPSAAEAAHSSRDVVQTHTRKARHEREVLLHHVRTALGLAPIRLDAIVVSIPVGTRIQ